MAIAHITNHYALAVARLPVQWQDSPRFLAWLKAYCDKIQEIEDTTWEVFTKRLLQNGPTGDLLAKIGGIVGQSNLGYSDSVYTLLIKARIPTNKSNGRKPDMINILSILTAGATVKAFDMPRTSFYMQAQGVSTVNPYIMFSQFLNEAIGAGVRLVFVYTVEPVASTLLWGSTYTTVAAQPTAAQSPGSTYAAGGGKWAGALSDA